MSKEDKEEIQKDDSKAELRRVWIFQGNQKIYDLYNSLVDENVKEAAWLVSRFRDEIRTGDVGLIWKAGKRSGIYAVGDVISNPHMMYDLEESRKYWRYESDRNQEFLRVKIRYKLRLRLTKALESTELQKIAELRNMEILKQSIGTNFRVTPEEWQTILNLLKTRFGFKE
jgi:predicted RNA-binding protein with PUA-like domain